jgi:coenzyme F420-reducing hydrogenase alpha subunit
MSKSRLPRRPRAPFAQTSPSTHELAAQDVVEAISLRIHQIAATAGVIAERLDDEPLSHVLYLIEECLLDVEARVEEFRQLGSSGG